MTGKCADVPLLQLIPESTLSEILVMRHYQAGNRVFEQGEPTSGLWFVLEGRVAMERVGFEGQLTTTGVWILGDIVGIAGLWDQSGYPASARALSTPTVMGWIARNTVLRLHQEIPSFGLEISRVLAERLRFIQESIADRKGLPMVNQVASVIWTLFIRMGRMINLTHEDVARLIGTRRETVTRAIHALARDGVIHSHHGMLEVTDAAKLQQWIAVVDKDRD
ncbi:cAMP-binding domain of CRP or a regulatory subunit of cAMP-dependent protein kinases [Sulfobacillus thermosulfidooxidans DSM 9293]|uniref:cAMP-binding domain of CRP or a regulatory subunit of cAMP-dependent protein kinases n=1 Tax=Sulfobacillus thermosulfidooxidans (strain DSM 9293 / VKM B-1269 / AT-1) TaxID=929705 RepID=A0A1W1WAY1_SULTA|nr:Crp/Fnr family transcriptional regulator [Sulfobacillus thermosulfidooxidans]SMC03468.1 cAMP-binding domain of CRP or a regulatory subunit of cAMP-dependent protein kinases [Sulfobacillus thermosulfidooxidans DSM 9293]